MLITRNDQAPRLHREATVAASATIVGNVEVGAGAYVDHGVLIESAGPPVVIGEEAIVFPGTVVRSVGGSGRPASAAHIGTRTLVSPSCVLTGCRIGSNCYVATGAIVLQEAVVGDHARIGAGAIVHATTEVPARARVGMRHVAVPTPQGFLSTADIEEARRLLAAVDFFETAFGAGEEDQARLHEQVMSTLLQEVRSWRDHAPSP